MQKCQHLLHNWYVHVQHLLILQRFQNEQCNSLDLVYPLNSSLYFIPNSLNLIPPICSQQISIDPIAVLLDLHLLYLKFSHHCEDGKYYLLHTPTPCPLISFPSQSPCLHCH